MSGNKDNSLYIKSSGASFMVDVLRVKKNRIWLYGGGFLFYAILLSHHFYDGNVNSYNTTVYAFSYKYGFMSRGLLGTMLRACNKVIPIELMSYEGVRLFSLGLQICFCLILIGYFLYCMRLIEEKWGKILLVLFFVFFTFTFPEFVTTSNLGRVDICMAMVSLLGIWILMAGKHEWLLPILAGIGMCFHQGYALMYLNVLLVIVFTKWIRENRKKYYTGILLLMLGVVGVLFVYINFFSQRYTSIYYEEIFKTAAALSDTGSNVHRELMMHEVLGKNPGSDEWGSHIVNFKEAIVFTIIMSPYLIIGGIFFRNCVLQAKNKEKLVYLAMASGPATLLPDFILKIDYGRWVFALVFYYFVIVISFLSKGDEIVCANVKRIADFFKNHKLIFVILLCYPLLITPFRDVLICDLSTNIIGEIFYNGKAEIYEILYQ